MSDYLAIIAQRAVGTFDVSPTPAALFGAAPQQPSSLELDAAEVDLSVEPSMPSAVPPATTKIGPEPKLEASLLRSPIVGAMEPTTRMRSEASPQQALPPVEIREISSVDEHRTTIVETLTETPLRRASSDQVLGDRDTVPAQTRLVQPLHIEEPELVTKPSSPEESSIKPDVILNAWTPIEEVTSRPTKEDRRPVSLERVVVTPTENLLRERETAVETIATEIVPLVTAVPLPKIAKAEPVVTPPITPATLETIVHVTIGRVEIRADVAPAKRTPGREAKQVSRSLEDYLRGASGGS